MTTRGLMAAIVLGVVGAIAVSSSIRVPYPTTVQEDYNRNVGELVGEREVGQLFESIRPQLTAVALQVATYSNRENTADVIFELRERVTDAEPLRRVVVSAREFRDHQLFAFTFDPIDESAGKTFYASLRSPESVVGNAVTLDYSNTNPYEKGTRSSMIILPDGTVRPTSLDGILKPSSDLTFRIVHRITLLEYLRLVSTRLLRDARAIVASDPSHAWLMARVAALGIAFGTLAVAARGRLVDLWMAHRRRIVVLGVFVLAGLGLRLLYVDKLPYTNDEGSYLYDARTILEGRLPGGDALAKSPIVIAAFAAGIALFGPILTAARLVSVIAGLGTGLCLYLIGRRFGGVRAGLGAALLWLLASAPALFTAYGHTQAVQVFLLAAGLAVLVSDRARQRWVWLVAAGALLGLSVVARKSSLAIALPTLLVLFFQGGTAKEIGRRILLTAAGAFLVLAIFLGTVHQLYGAPGVLYATGFDLAKTSIEQLDDRGDLYATYSIKGILPFFRESLPLVFLGLVGLGLAGEAFLSRFWKRGARLAWIVPLFLAWQGGRFLSRFEEEAHFSYGLWPFWVLMGVALLVLALRWWGKEQQTDQDRGEENRLVSVSLLWLLSVALFYAFWVKFHANYLLEFLPPIVLIGAVATGHLTKLLTRQRLLTTFFVFVIAWGAFTSTMIGYEFAHTGTFHWSAITETADFLGKNVPREEPVLTGAVIIPYLSGHRVPNDVAHPTWYGYGFIEPELRNVFMASTEEMVSDVQAHVRWAVLEQLTRFSYLREYTAIEKLLESSFADVQEIENLGNTITILQRIK